MVSCGTLCVVWLVWYCVIRYLWYEMYGIGMLWYARCGMYDMVCMTWCVLCVMCGMVYFARQQLKRHSLDYTPFIPSLTFLLLTADQL